MKNRRIAFVVFPTVVLLLLAGWKITSGASGYVYPSENTKSEFIRRYTPEHMQEVMKPFVAQTDQVGSSYGAGADKTFVTNNRTIEPYTAIRPARLAQLVAALLDDLSAQLTHDGAEILSETGAYPDRIRITYRLGQSVGAVELSLSLTNSRAGHYAQTGAMVEPPKGTEYMLARLAISEKWFPG